MGFMGNRITFDTLVNLVSGLGTTKDKTVHSRFTIDLLDKATIEAMFRADWIARKVVMLPPEDATREWRLWQAEDDQIERLEQAETNFAIRQKVLDASWQARLYGGAGLLLVVEGHGAASEELDVEQVTRDQLKQVHVVNRFQLTAGPLNSDILSPYYNLPEYYERSTRDQGVVRIHPSRLIRFLGNKLPDPDQVIDGWGESILQAVHDAIRAAGLVTGGVATLVHESKMDIIKMPDLAAHLTTQEYSDKLTARMTYANQIKSMINALLLDSEEDWQRITVNFQGMPDLLRMYLMIASAAADIPATRMLGQSPNGLNATGDSDIRNYYDKVKSEQKNILTPTLAPLDEVLIRSSLGDRDDSIYTEWAPLWQMTEMEKADLAAKKSSVFQQDLNAGIFPIPVMVQARTSQLIEDGTYPGLEIALEAAEGEESPIEEDRELRLAMQQKALAAPLPQPQLPGRGAPPTTPTGDAGFDPNQPRDPEGQWTEGGGSNIVKMTFAQPQAVPGKEDKISFKQLSGDVLATVRADYPQVARRLDVKPDSAFTVMKNGKPYGFFFEWRQKDAGGKEYRRTAVYDLRGNPITHERVDMGDAAHLVIRDASPRTLYVSRNVLNGDEIRAWAKSQGFTSALLPEDMHVTVMFSKTPVDWFAMGQDYSGYLSQEGRLTVGAGGPRAVETFGEGAVVLQFSNTQLQVRHAFMRTKGASWDHPEYCPHVTITYTGAPPDLSTVVPYRGKIELGPEIFKEVNENWKQEVEEVVL